MSLLRPLRREAVRRVAAAKLASDLGDWLLVAVVVGWVYGATASTAAVATLMLLRLAPPMLGGGLAAAVVDRVRKERLLVRVELVRAAAVATALAGIVFRLDALPYAALALAGALAALSGVTVRALVPALVPARELPAANAGFGIAQAAAMALGTLGAGLALTAASAPKGLAVVLCLSALAAVLYARVPALQPAARPQGLGVDLLAGVRQLRAHPLVLVVVSSFATATLATGLVMATLPRFLGGELGLGPSGYGFGQAALAGGLTVGEALVGLLPLARISARWIGWALLLMAASFAAAALSRDAAAALAFLALAGLVDGTTEVVFETVVQRECDPRCLGRVFGLAQMLMRTTMMAAVAVAPLVNRVAGPGTAILLASLWLVAAGAVALAGTATTGPRGAPRSRRLTLDAG